MSVVSLENDRLRIGVATHFGGRVVELLDKANGRDWIASGPEAFDTSEDAAYLGDACVGWDECFPTVSPWDASHTVWRRRLRDHGDIWGRPVQLVSMTSDSLTTRHRGPEATFTRKLSLAGASLKAEYALENLGGEPLPYLWALHALYAARPGERIVLPGVTAASATYLSRNGVTIDRSSLPWPSGDPAIGFPLDVVQHADAGFAGKLYATGFSSPWAAVGQEGEWLRISWDPNRITHSGLWLNYGGWPSVPGLHHVALEATTAAADHLGQALDRGEAQSLPAGAVRQWQVTHSLVDVLSKEVQS